MTSTEGFAAQFLSMIKSPFDQTTPEAAVLLEGSLIALFDSASDDAAEQLKKEVPNFKPGIETLRLFVLYAAKWWSIGAGIINTAKIPVTDTRTGKYLEFDDRGYIGAILSLPPEDRKVYQPILNELLETEEKLHPLYGKLKNANRQPEIQLTKKEWEDTIKVKNLSENQLLPAYFELYDLLKVYRGFHDYEDDKALDLASRMESITNRMVDAVNGKV